MRSPWSRRYPIRRESSAAACLDPGLRRDDGGRERRLQQANVTPAQAGVQTRQESAPDVSSSIENYPLLPSKKSFTRAKKPALSGLVSLWLSRSNSSSSSRWRRVRFFGVS